MSVKLLNMKGHLHGAGAPLSTLVAPILWGTTYVTVTELLPPDRPLLIAAARVLPAGIVLAGIAWHSSRWRPRGAQWRQTAILGLFNFGLFFPLLIAAIYRLPGGVAASVGGVQPLLVAAISRLLGVTRPRRRDLAIGCLAALGVAMVVIRPNASIDPVGVAAALGANLSFSIGVVLTKQSPRPESPVGSAGWQLLAAAALLVPLAVLIEGTPNTPTPINVAGFAYLSLIATGVAFLLWFNGIRRLPSPAPPLLGLAAPITGAVLGWTLRGENLTTLQIAGFVTTIGAIAYGATIRSTSQTRTRHARSSPVATGGVMRS